MSRVGRIAEANPDLSGSYFLNWNVELHLKLSHVCLLHATALRPPVLCVNSCLYVGMMT